MKKQIVSLESLKVLYGVRCKIRSGKVIRFWPSATDTLKQVTKVLKMCSVARHLSLNFLEKELATHSSALVWRIPWTKEPGGLLSVGSQRVGHDCAHTHPLPSKPHLNKIMFVILWFISLHIMPSSFTHCIQIDILLPLIQHLKNLYACTLTLFLPVYIIQGLQVL